MKLVAVRRKTRRDVRSDQINGGPPAFTEQRLTRRVTVLPWDRRHNLTTRRMRESNPVL